MQTCNALVSIGNLTLVWFLKMSDQTRTINRIHLWSLFFKKYMRGHLPMDVSVDQDYSGKTSIIEFSFNMAMIKEWMKLHSSKIWRLEQAMAHAIGYIKLASIYCLF